MAVFLIITVNFIYLLLTVNGKDTGTTTEIIQSYGYPFEEHTTTSVDGFQIVTHRIPYSPHERQYDVRVPVLLFHPQLMSSVCFVDNTREGSLAFLLADQGYDVWLTNVRGNRYSKKNQLLSAKTKEYWDFSYQESALYDVPPLIDYILMTTKHPKLFYIGVSMGATVGFFFLSALPQYNAKLHGFVAVAPVVFLDNIYNGFHLSTLKAITTTSLSIWPFNQLFKSVDLGSFNLIIKPMCGMATFWRFCIGISGSLTGDAASNINGSRMSIYLTHFPEITSMKTFNHYLQNKGGRFRMYDYGQTKNMAKYNQNSPPNLDFAKVTVPTAVFSSVQDKIANVKDVDALVQKLPRVEHFGRIDHKGFGHGSFLWGLTAPDLLFKPITNFLAKKVQEHYFPGMVVPQKALLTS